MYVPGTRLNEGGNLVFTLKKLQYWKSHPRIGNSVKNVTSITTQGVMTQDETEQVSRGLITKQA